MYGINSDYQFSPPKTSQRDRTLFHFDLTLQPFSHNDPYVLCICTLLFLYCSHVRMGLDVFSFLQAFNLDDNVYPLPCCMIGNYNQKLLNQNVNLYPLKGCKRET